MAFFTPQIAIIALVFVFPFQGLADAVLPKRQAIVRAKMIASGTSISGTPKLTKYVLPNGLRVLVLPDDRNPVATLRVRLKAGSRWERRKATGLAHFLEHMLFRKTLNFPEGHYDRVLGGVGGQGNAGTSTDYVVYFSTFPGPALEKVLPIEAERFMNLDLSEPYFSTEKGAVESERQLRYGNDPSQRAGEVLRRIVEKDTSYEWLTIGTENDVKLMSLETVKQFYADFYTPDNAIVSIGGPYSPETLLSMVITHFGEWKGKAKAQPIPFPQDYSSRSAGKTLQCSEKLTEQTWKIVYPSEKTSYREQVLMELFSVVLDDHPEGPFSRRLVQADKAITVAPYKTTWQFDYQPVTLYIKLKKDQDFTAVKKLWENELERILKAGFSAEARARLSKQYTLYEASLARKMTSLIEMYEENEFYFNNPFESAFSHKILSSISQQEFRNWVKSTFQHGSAYTLGAVPPRDGVKPCAEL